MTFSGKYTKVCGMNISTTNPDVPLTEAWLREQLKKPEIFSYLIDGQKESNIFINTVEPEEYGVSILFSVVDKNPISLIHYVIYQQVVFEVTGLAFVMPGLPDGTVRDCPVAFPEITKEERETYGEFGHYQAGWIKGTWIDGLAALARSVASRFIGLGFEESQRVGQLLDELGSIAPQPAQVTVTS